MLFAVHPSDVNESSAYLFAFQDTFVHERMGTEAPNQSNLVNASKDPKGLNHMQTALKKEVKSQRSTPRSRDLLKQKERCSGQQLARHGHGTASYDRKEASKPALMRLELRFRRPFTFRVSQKVYDFIVTSQNRRSTLCRRRGYCLGSHQIIINGANLPASGDAETQFASNSPQIRLKFASNSPQIRLQFTPDHWWLSISPIGGEGIRKKHQ
jgi:hypothetical protein